MLKTLRRALQFRQRANTQPSSEMTFDPATFPRPPLLEKISKRLLITWPSGAVIADTTQGYWVLETYHPPTYYIPPSDIKVPLRTTRRRTMCEWKGPATYFSVPAPEAPGTNDGVAAGGAVDDRAWCYERPTPRFAAIAGYVSFYVGPWECFVDGERVEPQPGDGRFYGGWVTSEIQGTIKGAPGTLGW